MEPEMLHVILPHPRDLLKTELLTGLLVQLFRRVGLAKNE